MCLQSAARDYEPPFQLSPFDVVNDTWCKMSARNRSRYYICTSKYNKIIKNHGKQLHIVYL